MGGDPRSCHRVGRAWPAPGRWQLQENALQSAHSAAFAGLGRVQIVEERTTLGFWKGALASPCLERTLLHVHDLCITEMYYVTTLLVRAVIYDGKVVVIIIPMFDGFSLRPWITTTRVSNGILLPL